MRASRFRTALDSLSAAMREVETALEEMRAEHDPLAVHIFVARRAYRHTHDTKSGKRRALNARLAFEEACALGSAAI